jgi:ABC-2 family transporter protein
MLAMTWRQHRLQLLVAAAVLAAAAGYLIFGAWQHASYASQIGLTACLNARPHRNCGLQAEVFFSRFGGIPGPFIMLAALPLLAGLFLGAPLLAREAEAGTLQLAWTQSVPRTRWLTVKLTTFLAAIGIAAAVLSVCFSAWLSVYNEMSFAGYTTVNRMEPPAFDLSGVAPLGAVLFSFALGTVAGVLIRRTVPAMAIALGGYVGVILPLSSVRYTAFFRPRTVSGSYSTTSMVQPGGYALRTTYSDSSGHPVPFNTLYHACAHAVGHGQSAIAASCLAAKGFHLSESFQPASNYWPLQAVCATILVAAAAALLGFATWWSARRPA